MCRAGVLGRVGTDQARALANNGRGRGRSRSSARSGRSGSPRCPGRCTTPPGSRTRAWSRAGSRRGRSCRPASDPCAVPSGIEHVGVAEVPRLHRHGPVPTNAHSGTGTCSTWVVTISKMHAWRIISGSAAWTFGSCSLARSRLRSKFGLAAPQAEAPADELGAGVLEHPDVVVEVAPAVEQALHRDRPGQVVLQHLPRDRPVETIVARLCGRLRGRLLLPGEDELHDRLRVSRAKSDSGPCLRRR